jgi:hypothetical protein
MRKRLAAVAISAAIALPVLGGGAPPAAATSSPVASASCTSAKTPGGVKCLQPGEYCSHKPGYAKAYRRAGYRCNREGRLEYR